MLYRSAYGSDYGIRAMHVGLRHAIMGELMSVINQFRIFMSAGASTVLAFVLFKYVSDPVECALLLYTMLVMVDEVFYAWKSGQVKR